MSAAIRQRLRPAVKRYAGGDIVYVSGVTGERYSIVATFDRSVAETETDESITFRWFLKDFKIDVTDLPVFPQRLDSIEWTDEYGNIRYFAVLDDGSTSGVEMLSNFGHTYLIHTKQVPAPAAINSTFGNLTGFAYGNKDGVAYGSSHR